MRDEADFLRALGSDPGDDVARLAFADWLEERNDPRAPWVRDPVIFRWMGPAAGDPVPALLEALRRDEYPRSYEAAAVLVRIGAAAVPALLAEIEGGGRGARHAGGALAEMEAPLVLPILDRLLELAVAGDEKVHGPAIQALQAVGPAALPALPALIRVLPGGHDHWQSDVAERAVRVLKNLGPAAVDAVPVLLEQYVYPETQATEALVAIGPAGVPKVLAHIPHLDSEIYLRAAEPLEQLGAEVVPLLRQALAGGEQKVRAVAALALAKTDPEAALPHLLEALESGPCEEDEHALMNAIGEMGSAAASAAPTLRRLFNEGVIDQYSLTETLSRLESAEAVGQRLLEQLQSTAPRERSRALAQLQALEVVPPGAREAWLPLLEDTDPEVRKAAVCVAGKLAEPGDAEALTLLRPLLHHPDAAVREQAVIGRQRIGGPDLASELLPLIDDSSWHVREAVLEALQTAEGSIPAVAEALCRCLEDLSAGVQSAACKALAARPDVLAEAMPTLVAMLAVDRLPATAHACKLVRHFPLPVARRVALLGEGLSSQHAQAGGAAALALSSMLKGGEGREEAAVMVPDLVRLVEREPSQAWAVGQALERIGALAVPHLLPHLGHASEHVQGCVLQGLKGAGEAAAAALPGLLGVLKSANPSHLELAAEIAGRIGPAAAVARNDLLRLLRDQSPGVRQAAVEALAVIGPAPNVLSAVSALSSDDSDSVRESVLRAVGRLGTAEEALGLLAAGLGDSHRGVRRSAVEGLIALGERGRAALRGLPDDEDPEIRGLVSAALAR